MKNKVLVFLGYLFIIVCILAMLDKGTELVLDGFYYAAKQKAWFLSACLIAFLTGRISKHS